MWSLQRCSSNSNTTVIIWVFLLKLNESPGYDSQDKGGGESGGVVCVVCVWTTLLITGYCGTAALSFHHHYWLSIKAQHLWAALSKPLDTKSRWHWGMKTMFGWWNVDVFQTDRERERETMVWWIAGRRTVCPLWMPPAGCPVMILAPQLLCERPHCNICLHHYLLSPWLPLHHPSSPLSGLGFGIKGLDVKVILF